MSVMTRARCQDARIALEKALKEIDPGEFEVTVGTARYAPERGEATFKLTVRLPGSQNEAFETDAKRLGLAVKLGQEFKYSGGVYEITGINLRAPKYPVLAKKLSGAGAGKVYKLSASAVAHAIALANL